jgi:hypothetical protein
MMNKFTVVGIIPDSNEDAMPYLGDYENPEDYANAVEGYMEGSSNRVQDIMKMDTTFIVAEHTLGHITDESFRLLMDYLSKYDAMLRGEI